MQTACLTLEFGLMLDWERSSYPDRPIPSTAAAEAFLQRLAQLAPKAAISVYTAQWVIGSVGASSLATKYPLVWSSQLAHPYAPNDPPQDPRDILKDVTPGWFQASGAGVRTRSASSPMTPWRVGFPAWTSTSATTTQPMSVSS